MAKAVRCLNCGQMGGKHSFPNFHCPDHANKGKFLADQTMQSDIGTPIRKRLLDALGWQGGTVAEALAEVRRLRADAVHVPDWSTLRPDVVGWIPVACYRDNMGVICQWDAVGPMRPRPVLGHGVAALLPEHGEVKP